MWRGAYLNTSDLSPTKVGSSVGVSSFSYTPKDRSSYTFVDLIDMAIATYQLSYYTFSEGTYGKWPHTSISEISYVSSQEEGHTTYKKLVVSYDNNLESERTYRSEGAKLAIGRILNPDALTLRLWKMASENKVQPLNLITGRPIWRRNNPATSTTLLISTLSSSSETSVSVSCIEDAGSRRRGTWFWGKE